MDKSEEQWREELSPEEYHILREAGTEYPFSGEYANHKEKGAYHCAGCGHPLFDSAHKYDSGSGWPSFWDVPDSSRFAFDEDTKLAMPRIEVRCRRCGSHLGHVFPDGPPPTGQRYCINSRALKFKPHDKKE